MVGRRSTIKTNPKAAEIQAAILSGEVSYREIAEQFGISLSAVKRFASALKTNRNKNEPQKRNVPERHSTPNPEDRFVIQKRQIIEEELRNQQSAQAAPSVTARPVPAPLQESDEARARRALDDGNRALAHARLAAIEKDRKRRWYSDPFNWREPCPSDFL